MDLKTYNKIRSFCAGYLGDHIRDSHLEDMTQHLAMEHFKAGGHCRWDWICAYYCRLNGLNSNKKSKMTARTLNISMSIDMPSGDHEDQDSSYLLDQESIERYEVDQSRIFQSDNFKGLLEEFLAPLNLNKETKRWAMNWYKVKTNLK